MQSYAIGQTISRFASLGDTMYISISGNVISLLCALTDPSPEDVSAFSADTPFRLTCDRFDDLLVMTAKFGPIEYDATYTPHLGTPPSLAMPYEPYGYPLHVLLVDQSGTIRAMRVLGLPTSFSRVIYTIIHDISSQPFDTVAYHRSIRSMYARFPTVASLAAVARAVCTQDGCTLSPHAPRPEEPRKTAVPPELEHLRSSRYGDDILAIPDRFADQAAQKPEDYQVPMPVRFVLSQGYTFLPDGKNIVVPCEYDDFLGLILPDEYDPET